MLCLTWKRWLKVIFGLVLIEIVVILLSELRLHVWSSSDSGPPLETLNGYHDDETAESFLRLYQTYCSEWLYPKMSNVPKKFITEGYSNDSLCLCLPDTIDRRKGEFQADNSSSGTAVQLGGTWLPTTCIARQRVAVIIPFRDRGRHLTTLLPVLHSLMQAQQLHYTVYVVEQKSPAMFNKAVLMNAGFLEASKDADYDCYIFHDVDMIPEDVRNIYVCSQVPRHIGSYLAQWDYRLMYDGIFGGVTAFTKHQFIKVNGFSNQYYGWGGEDDDMHTRIIAQGYSIVRFPRSIARYHMIEHDADHSNPYNVRSSVAFLVRPQHYASDGVNSVRYEKITVQKQSLYTWILISLPEPPKNFKGYQRLSFFSGCVRASTTLTSSLLLLLSLSGIVIVERR